MKVNPVVYSQLGLFGKFKAELSLAAFVHHSSRAQLKAGTKINWLHFLFSTTVWYNASCYLYLPMSCSTISRDICTPLVGAAMFLDSQKEQSTIFQERNVASD